MSEYVIPPQRKISSIQEFSWADTYKAMADEKEHWDEFDSTLLDGLEEEEFED